MHRVKGAPFLESGYVFAPYIPKLGLMSPFRFTCLKIKEKEKAVW